MDRRYKIKVWKDRLANVYPAKWSWEVVENIGTRRVIGCGTTPSERQSQLAADMAVEARVAYLGKRYGFGRHPDAAADWSRGAA